MGAAGPDLGQARPLAAPRLARFTACQPTWSCAVELACTATEQLLVTDLIKQLFGHMDVYIAKYRRIERRI